MAQRRGVFGPLALGTALASAVLAAALSLPPASMALTLAPDPESGTEPGDVVGPTPHRPRYLGPCNRVPPGVVTERSPGYNNFSIVISGNPKKYVPGEAYTGSRPIFADHHCGMRGTGLRPGEDCVIKDGDVTQQTTGRWKRYTEHRIP
ncbi:hypothetical protein HPB49_017674 [Dermacentor silvarum]|uniref:Uncharacterized protein n=1 Tax=Dermacentor silvarum TaxID=543639 RepID=A0ACB8C4S4_DERSI|nr:hypothetical protein HPB49_017674 [Dermacentor silvarum]